MRAARKPPASPEGCTPAPVRAALLVAAALAAVALLFAAAPAALRLRSGAPSASGCEAPDGFNVLYCGADLMAITPGAVPAPPDRVPPYDEVRVVNARGAVAAAERTHFILQSLVFVAQRRSGLNYVEVGAEHFMWVLHGGANREEASLTAAPRVLLLGLGAGALPLALQRLCDERPELRSCPSLQLTAVDASADSLAITRQFVLPDDGVRLRYVHDTAERYIAAAAQAAARGASPAGLAKLLPRRAGPGGEPYDLIVNDAYAGAVGQGRDVAFLKGVAAALRPGSGIYCVNVLSTGADQGAHLRAEASMETVFGAETRIAVDGSNAWLCATAPAANASSV